MMRMRFIRDWMLVSAVIFALFAGPAYAIAYTRVSHNDDLQLVNGGDTALNWAGYVATGDTYTSVSATWNVPTVTGTSENQADATWVGIGGVRSSDLIQAGTQSFIDSSGAVSYEAWYEVLPQDSKRVPLQVHAGDTVTVSIQQQSAADGTWLITYDNTSTGQQYSMTIRYASSLSSAEWIEEVPAGVGQHISLDDFGSIDFSDATTIVNGATVSASDAGAKSVTMSNTAQEAIAVPTVFGPDGESFSVERTDAESNAIAIGGNYGHAGRGSRYRVTQPYTTYPDPGTSTSDQSTIDPNLNPALSALLSQLAAAGFRFRVVRVGT